MLYLTNLVMKWIKLVPNSCGSSWKRTARAVVKPPVILAAKAPPIANPSERLWSPSPAKTSQAREAKPSGRAWICPCECEWPWCDVWCSEIKTRSSGATAAEEIDSPALLTFGLMLTETMCSESAMGIRFDSTVASLPSQISWVAQ